MTDLDTKAIRERAEKQVREYARLAWLRVERGGAGHGGDTLHGIALGGPDGGEADITASGLRVVLDALDAARAELEEERRLHHLLTVAMNETGMKVIGERDAARADLAQAKQEREMLRQALLAWKRMDEGPLSSPGFDDLSRTARRMILAALDGTKETA